MTNFIKILLFTAVIGILLMISAQSKANTPLSFQQFLTEKGIGEGLPDFSHAGFNGNAEEIPVVTKKNYKYFNITNYGAIPNDGKSDREAIIKTIAAAEQYDGKAVVFFPKGRFILRDKNDLMSDEIFISKDNIVLQGSGMYLGGTELITKAPTFKSLLSFRLKNANERWNGYSICNITSQITRGENYAIVDDTSNLKVDQYVNIIGMLPNTNNKKMQDYFKPHQPSGLFLKDINKRPWVRRIKGRHRIKNIDKNLKKITFTEPIQFSFKQTENVRLTTDFKDGQHYLKNVGIENLAITSEFKELYAHYKNLLVDGYNFINFSYTINSWARNIRLRNYTNAIRPSGGMYNTFYNIQLEGNAGHMSLSGYNSYGNLYAYVREFTDSHHGFGGTDNHVNGVFLRCVQCANLEAHCKFPHATLFDVNEGQFARLRMGGAMKTPHHGPDLVYWNWNNSNSFFGNGYNMIADTRKTQNIDFWPAGSRYGFVFPPYIVGLHGIKVDIKDQKTDIKINENQGRIVCPVSLFEAQIKARLGKVPSWIIKRNNSFEKVSRYSRIQFSIPKYDSNYVVGQIINLRARIHPKMNLKYVKKVELYQSVSFDFDYKKSKKVYISKDKFTTRYKCSTKGAKFLFLVMTNVLGEQSISDPLVINVSAAKNSDTFVKPVKVYFGVKHTKKSSRDIFGIANKEAFKNSLLKARQDSYISKLRELEANEHAIEINNANNIKHAQSISNGNEKDSVPFFKGYGTSYVFDLGKATAIKGIQLVFAKNISTANIAFEIQTSNNSEALQSAYNNDNFWETQRRVGRTLINQQYQVNGKIMNVYMTMKKARFIRIWVRKSNLPISEIKIIKY
ncbi:DUF4955 domain-containing protein [Lentisphaerota bacterium WC36G]|nr:DUF4955 domain-containing protein [Lentisphaerae bacterium WC36]